jgi:uncharacterized BrkB/YihY/UPF0761 family membrane protein
MDVQRRRKRNRLESGHRWPRPAQRGRNTPCPLGFTAWDELSDLKDIAGLDTRRHHRNKHAVAIANPPGWFEHRQTMPTDRCAVRFGHVRRAAKRVKSFYWGSGLCDDVPALAWYLVAACVPLMLGIAALAAIVLGDGAQAEKVATQIANVLPRSARDQVLELVLRTRRDSPLLLAVAIVSMVWTSAGATGVIERVESRLLAAHRAGSIALKLRHLGLAAGMVLMITLMATAATEAANIRGRLSFRIPGWVLSLASAIVIAAICSLLFRFATARQLRWRAALAGGLPAALVLELTPLAAGYYARAVAGRTPVQVFLVLGGLLFACYLVALGLLVEGHVHVGGVVLGELERDLKHPLRVQGHPRRTVRLLQRATARQRRRAIEDADVVQSQEAALEQVPAIGILAIDPPGELAMSRSNTRARNSWSPEPRISASRS